MGIELQKQYRKYTLTESKSKKQKITIDSVFASSGLEKYLFSFLDLKSLMRCRVVCSAWKNCIQNVFPFIWCDMEEISRFINSQNLKNFKNEIPPCVFDNPTQWMKSIKFFERLSTKNLADHVDIKTKYHSGITIDKNMVYDGEDVKLLCCFSGKPLEKGNENFERPIYYRSLRFRPPSILVNTSIEEKTSEIRIYTKPQDGISFARDIYIPRKCLFGKPKYIETHWIVPISFFDKEKKICHLEFIFIPCEKEKIKNPREHISSSKEEDLFFIVKTNEKKFHKRTYNIPNSTKPIKCITQRGILWYATCSVVYKIEKKFKSESKEQEENDFCITEYPLSYNLNAERKSLLFDFKILFGIPTLVDIFSNGNMFCTRFINGKAESILLKSFDFCSHEDAFKLYEKEDNIIFSFYKRNTILLDRKNWMSLVTTGTFENCRQLPSFYRIRKVYPMIVYEENLSSTFDYYFTDRLLFKQDEIDKLKKISEDRNLKFYCCGLIIPFFSGETLFGFKEKYQQCKNCGYLYFCKKHAPDSSNKNKNNK